MNASKITAIMVAICWLLVMEIGPVWADELDRQKKALGIISEYADNICGDVPLHGNSNKFELSGRAKADLPGVLKKLADLGVEGAAKYQNSKYQGLLQSDLVKVLKDSRDCKQRVSDKLVDKLIPTKIPSKEGAKAQPKRTEKKNKQRALSPKSASSITQNNQRGVATPETKINPTSQTNITSYEQKGGITAQNVTINTADKDIPLTGLLMPANEPDPPNNCNIPTEGMKIFLGSSVAWVSTMGIHTVLKIGGRDVITIEKRMDGLFVSATIKREDGRIVAEIKDNNFSINPNNYFELKRSDRHELAVLDKTKQQVLYVRYINENTVIFQGKFQEPGYPLVNAEKDKIVYETNTVSPSCVGNIGGAAFSFQ